MDGLGKLVGSEDGNVRSRKTAGRFGQRPGNSAEILGDSKGFEEDLGFEDV